MGFSPSQATVVAIEDANQSAKQNIIQGHTQVRGLRKNGLSFGGDNSIHSSVTVGRSS